MKGDDYSALLDGLARSIKDPDIRSCMLVASRAKLYPRDCLTNGSLEQLMRKITAYEEKILALGGTL